MKVDKESVKYRRAARPLRSCGTCGMFRPRNPNGRYGSCTLVIGTIDARDVCDRWERRKNT